jgi:membrane-associated phospholipid phosphatase
VQALAARIARNREIAGLHYPSDTAAGIELAGKIWVTLMGLEAFQNLSKVAMDEWKGIA